MALVLGRSRSVTPPSAKLAIGEIRVDHLRVVAEARPYFADESRCLAALADAGFGARTDEGRSRETKMREYLKFYIDGKWVEPTELKTLDVENPATEETAGKIALGNAADVDKAVKAARKAFATWSQTTLEER